MKFPLIFSLCFVALCAFAQLPWTIKVGSSPNNEDGDSIQIALQKINSNMVWLANNSGGGGGGPATNINGAALVSNSVNSNKLDVATRAMFGFVPDPLSVNAFSANSATITSATGNAAGLTNSFFTKLHFQVASNAFTNVICGYIRLTNDDGRAFTIGVGTNLP